MLRLSKKEKQEWDFFINPKTGRRTYNKFCRNVIAIANKTIVPLLFTAAKFAAKRSVITKGDKYTIKNFKLIQVKKIADFLNTKSIQKRSVRQ